MHTRPRSTHYVLALALALALCLHITLPSCYHAAGQEALEEEPTEDSYHPDPTDGENHGDFEEIGEDDLENEAFQPHDAFDAEFARLEQLKAEGDSLADVDFANMMAADHLDASDFGSESAEEVIPTAEEQAEMEEYTKQHEREAQNRNWDIELSTQTVPAVVAAADAIRREVFSDPELSAWPSLNEHEHGHFTEEAKRELTYGEITVRSLDKALELANATSSDSFLDIGSGDGKVLLSAYFLRNFRQVSGIEYVPSRFEKSCLMMDVMRTLAEWTPTKADEEADVADAAQRPLAARISLSNTLRLALQSRTGGLISHWGDARNISFADIDLIYMCNTCFGPELARALMDRFALLKQGSRIICLHELPRNHPATAQFQLVVERDMPMTWTAATPVLIYRKITPPTPVAESPKWLETEGNDIPSLNSYGSVPTCHFTPNTQTGHGRVAMNFDLKTYNPQAVLIQTGAMTEHAAPDSEEDQETETDIAGDEEMEGLHEDHEYEDGFIEEEDEEEEVYDGEMMDDGHAEEEAYQFQGDFGHEEHEEEYDETAPDAHGAQKMEHDEL